MHAARRVVGVIGIAALMLGCAPSATTNPSGSTSMPPVPASETAADATPTTPAPEPTPTSGQPAPLIEALGYAGSVISSVSFTDWAAIREGAGADALTGSSPFEEKALAIRNEAMLGGFGLAELRTHAETWGFDVYDLDWELTVQSGREFFWVLRFRETFDPAGLGERLDAYGFGSQALAHGVLREGGLAAIRNAQPPSSNVAFSNVGLLDDARTVVLSAASANAVRRVLQDGPVDVADPSAQSVARSLGQPAAATIDALDACLRLDDALAMATAAARPSIESLLAAAGDRQAFNTLGIGYSRRGGPLGQIVLGYATEAEAHADLEVRRRLATDGMTLRPSRPYRESTFTVVGGYVTERAVVLELGRPSPSPGSTAPAPPSGSFRPDDLFPRGLIGMVAQHDTLFAMCPA